MSLIQERIRVKSARGFTMIELLIGFSLLGAVLGAAWSLYFYGFTSFSRGEQQMAKQQSARLVARVLSETIRQAEKISFDSKTIDLKDFRYIYVDKDGNVVRSDNGGEPSIIATAPEGAQMSLDFLRAHDAENIIHFTVGVLSDDGVYEIESSVYAQELPVSHWMSLKPDRGKVLCYKP